ncbi:TROVE domain-containing protein [bacterium]|nr:TROVE domain-containing protein [bacterium]
MANKNLFQTFWGKLLPQANAVNEAGGRAYDLGPKHALAQYAATGCLNGTFYADAATQLEKVLALCDQVEPAFIAKTAAYCREQSFMKDMPALLCAALAKRDVALLERVFDRVIDNGKMLRNFVQIVRSGVTGRKSLGSAPKRLVRQWFESRSPDQVFRASIGQSPSFADILKMVHPKPATSEREALYGWMIGRAHKADALPQRVQAFEAFKRGDSPVVPDVPFQMLTALTLDRAAWVEIARNAPWQMTRMNLNTFARHGVFDDARLTDLVANRLRDAELIRKARAFPYQLMAAFMNIGSGMPKAIANALQDAMEIAIRNVPKLPGRIVVCPDVSGSMHSSVTGFRAGSTSKVRCVEVAALVAAAFLRQNPDTEVLPFESDVVPVRLNSRDSVMTNAQKLASLPCGGTNCSAPLRLLADTQSVVDLVIFVSDNESWIDTPRHGYFGGSATETMKQWSRVKSRNPRARMVCVDIQPYATAQAAEREDIVNIGGFSDQVFELISLFAKGELNADHWVGVIESTTL